MSGRVLFERHYQAMRGAQLLAYAGLALPLTVAGLVYWLPRPDGALAAAGLALGVLLAIVLLLDIARRSRRVTRARIATHLDRQYPQLQDSTTLLLARRATLSPVAALQRQRVDDALTQLRPTLRGLATRRYRWPMALASGLLGVALVLNLQTLLAWLPQPAQQVPATDAPVLMLEQVLFDVAPPDYTGRKAYAIAASDITIPAGSRIRITADITAASDVAWLPNSDTVERALFAADARTWQSEWWSASATTYALTDQGVPIANAEGVAVHRIALLDDAPPDIHIVAPSDRVHVVADDSAPLLVRIEVSDDYGISDIQLSAVLSEGDGEQVSFQRQGKSIFEATGNVREHTMTYALDAKSLGLQVGGELYVSFVARDNRTPAMQSGETATLILRWPDPAGDAQPLLDNQVVAIMPEYFRSQRQLIIDTEALLLNAPDLSSDEFAQLAQELALDQQALRLRYGAFLGEESSGEPVAGAQTLAQAAARAALNYRDSDSDHDDHEHSSDDDDAAHPHAAGHFAGDGHEHAEDEDLADTLTGHYLGDGHDHTDEDFVAAAAPGSRAGDAAAAIAPYAHVHDEQGQAAVFDPQTRALLRDALSEMWQSESFLRQHTPKPSLPHQYRALALIKQAQRSSRVFVERIGFEPRPIDPARRLTGELDEIERRTQLAVPVDEHAAVAATRAANTMARLLAGRTIGSDEDVQSLLVWLQQSGRSRDAQAQAAFLDAEAQLRSWQQQAECVACRARLATFWQRYAPPQDRLPARMMRADDLFKRAD